MDDRKTPRELYHEFIKSLSAISNHANLDDVPERRNAGLVEAGAILITVIEDCQDALEDIKSDLRARAEYDLQHVPGTVEYDGEGLGTCKITVSEDRLTISKGADIARLKQDLGPRFGSVFIEKVSYSLRKDAQESILQLDDEERDTCFENLESKAQTPRVSFKFNREAAHETEH